MEVKITYSIFDGRCCAEAEVAGVTYNAISENWEAARIRLIGKIRDTLAIDPPPPPETVEI